MKKEDHGLSNEQLLRKYKSIRNGPCSICLDYGEVIEITTGNRVDCPKGCWYPNKYPDM